MKTRSSTSHLTDRKRNNPYITTTSSVSLPLRHSSKPKVHVIANFDAPTSHCQIETLPLIARHLKDLEHYDRYHLLYDLIGSRYSASSPELTARADSKEYIDSDAKPPTFYQLSPRIKKVNMGSQTSRHWECEPPVPTITLNGCDMNSNLGPRHAAALSARAKKTASRIAVAQAKAEMHDRQQAEQMAEHSAKSKEKQRKTADAETEAQKLKKKRIAAEINRRERKALENKVEKAAREERRRRAEQTDDEKRRRRHMEGVAWGFDDRAGKRRGLGSTSKASSTNGGCYVSDGRTEDTDGTAAADNNVHEVDEIGRRTGRRWHRGNTWGVEAGGPGKEVVFEFGVPIDPRKPKKSGSWSRRGRS